MAVGSVLVIFSVAVIVCGNPITNVRLVGHEDYIISVIEKTVNEVEKLGWCNLKLNDISLDLDEDVLGTNVMGYVQYTNGFVVSIQWVDILSSSVQQFWRFDRIANTTRVEVTGALRMHSVTLGFDVIVNMANGNERYTATFVLPLLQFNFAVIKDMFLDDIDVTVGLAPLARTTNVPRFMPDTPHSQIFASLYNWNSTTIGVMAWALDVFRPIAYKLALNEIQFPRVCYDCPVR